MYYTICIKSSSLAMILKHCNNTKNLIKQVHTRFTILTHFKQPPS